MLQVRHEVGGPDLIRREEDQDLDLVVRVDEAPPTIASATLTLYDANGTAVVTAGACTIPEQGRARYALAASLVPSTLTFALGWRGVWSLTIGSAVSKVTRDYALCKYVPRCPVVGDDLYARQHRLRSMIPVGQSTWSPQILEAWIEITQDLYDAGRRPWLIVSEGSLRKHVLLRSLELANRALATGAGADSQFVTRAEEYAEELSKLPPLRFDYDSDEDGIYDGQRAASPVVHLSAGPRRPQWVGP